MSHAIDVAAVLTALEDQEEQQQAELTKTQSAIAALRPLVDGKPRANGKKPKTTRPSARPAPAKLTKGAGRGNPIPPDVLAVMKAMYEKGAPIPEIMKATGRTMSSIYGYASKLNWKRPTKAKIVAAAVTLPSTQLGGRVSCPSCHLKTERDPCEHCGKAVRK